MTYVAFNNNHSLTVLNDITYDAFNIIKYIVYMRHVE